MKNKHILFSGIIVAIIIFQTEFSDVTKIWKPKVEAPRQHVEIFMIRPTKSAFEKRKPLNHNCFVNQNMSENKYWNL